MKWQPIETAPKDGTHVLLRSRKNHLADGCWITANSQCGGWAWAYLLQEPTHWMQMPEPPHD